MTQFTVGECSWQPIPIAGADALGAGDSSQTPLWVLGGENERASCCPRCPTCRDTRGERVSAPSAPEGPSEGGGFLWFGHVWPLAFTWGCSELCWGRHSPAGPRAPRGTGSGAPRAAEHCWACPALVPPEGSRHKTLSRVPTYQHIGMLSSRRINQLSALCSC